MKNYGVTAFGSVAGAVSVWFVTHDTDAAVIWACGGLVTLAVHRLFEWIDNDT